MSRIGPRLNARKSSPARQVRAARDRHIRPEQEPYVLAEIAKGRQASKVAAELGVSPGCVRRLARRYELPLLPGNALRPRVKERLLFGIVDGKAKKLVARELGISRTTLKHYVPAVRA